jgi:hypothetical protein
MCELRRIRSPLSAAFSAVVLALLWAGSAVACPTCKDSIANDPASASLAQGFYYSILFMVSAPYVIFGSLAAYFYWQIRKARARQAAVASETQIAVQSQ